MLAHRHDTGENGTRRSLAGGEIWALDSGAKFNTGNSMQLQQMEAILIIELRPKSSAYPPLSRQAARSPDEKSARVFALPQSEAVLRKPVLQ